MNCRGVLRPMHGLPLFSCLKKIPQELKGHHPRQSDIEFRHFSCKAICLSLKLPKSKLITQVALWTNQQILTFCGPQTNYSSVKQCWAGITFLKYPMDKNIHLSFIP